MPKPRASRASKVEMPSDTCGSCSFCHPLDIPAKPLWCFVEPPYPFIGDEPEGTPNRGAETRADAPACHYFNPRRH